MTKFNSAMKNYSSPELFPWYFVLASALHWEVLHLYEGRKIVKKGKNYQSVDTFARYKIAEFVKSFFSDL